ncbi:MAG TPA: hypothetical protein VHW23_20595 [Kofleriaceae bacterium]|nr:hypothetical protein [Kofleriaceae bacterium]
MLCLGSGLGACGGGNGTPHDAAPDMAPSVCGADASFAGEMIDWDSTEANFCGVAGAVWTVRGDTARTETTPPNGRLAMCLAHQTQTILDITPPAGGSQCPALFNTPMNTYPMAAVAIVPGAVLVPGASFSVRAMVQSRLTSMETQIGAPLDPSKGQLYIHVVGTPHAITISAAHGAAQRFDGSQWAAGDTGSDVLFPNVDLSGGVVGVTIAGNVVGNGNFTLEPGKLTYLMMVVNTGGDREPGGGPPQAATSASNSPGS